MPIPPQLGDRRITSWLNKSHKHKDEKLLSYFSTNIYTLNEGILAHTNVARTEQKHRGPLLEVGISLQGAAPWVFLASRIQNRHSEAPRPTAGPEPALCFPLVFPTPPDPPTQVPQAPVCINWGSRATPLEVREPPLSHSLPLTCGSRWNSSLEAEGRVPRRQIRSLQAPKPPSPQEAETDMWTRIPRLSFSPLWQRTFPDSQLSSQQPKWRFTPQAPMQSEVNDVTKVRLLRCEQHWVMWPPGCILGGWGRGPSCASSFCPPAGHGRATSNLNPGNGCNSCGRTERWPLPWTISGSIESLCTASRQLYAGKNVHSSQPQYPANLHWQEDVSLLRMDWKGHLSPKESISWLQARPVHLLGQGHAWWRGWAWP